MPIGITFVRVRSPHFRAVQLLRRTQFTKYTAPSSVVNCLGSPPAAGTTNSCGYFPTNDTNASCVPSELQRTRPQGVVRVVSCRRFPPSRSMVNTFGTPSLTAMNAIRFPSGEISGPSVEPCRSFAESLNSTYWFPSVSRWRFLPSAPTRYTFPSRRSEDNGFAVRRELRHETLGVIGRQLGRQAIREAGDQQAVASGWAGEDDAVIGGAHPRHVDVAELRSYEPGRGAVRIGNHHAPALAIVDREDHLAAVGGQDAAVRILHGEGGRPLQLLRQPVRRGQTCDARTVPPTTVDLGSTVIFDWK